jgi:hypothetical protein
MVLGACAMLALGSMALVWSARDQEPAAKEEPIKIAASRITHVTVYPNSALVTREVDVPAGKGNQELVVSPLPQHTINSSLYSESADGIRVLTTRFRNRPVKEDTREEVRKVEDDIRKAQMKGQELQALVEANKQNSALLGKLETFTSASTQHATEKGKLDADATITLAKYLMEGRSDKVKESVRLQQEIQDNQEKLEFLNRKHRDMTAGSSKTERDAVIVVDKTNAAVGKIRLNYLVDMAAWRPQYKFRAGKGMKDPVQVEYLAAVIQQTGEDWGGVELTLSTAQPALNAAPPDLMVLAVGVVNRGTQVAAQPIPNPPEKGASKGGGQAGQPAPQQVIANPSGNSADELTRQAMNYRKQAQEEFNLRNAEIGNEFSNYAGALEQARDLVVLGEGANKDLQGKVVLRGGRNDGPSVTYHLNTKLTVPSRNDEQVIEVARIEMQPEYFYKAVPVLTPQVYREANLVNKSKFVLLPGEGTMYHETDFVGRMKIPQVAVGEQFTVGFGAEPQLQVQRVMVDKQRTQQGGNQILSYQYRILLSSFMSERVKLQVWDRLPHAENETMGVTLVKAEPQLCKDPLYTREERPNNLLRWDLEIDPNQNGEKALEINYDFKLELDRQMTIGTIQSKK